MCKKVIIIVMLMLETTFLLANTPHNGTSANYVLTNKIYATGDNVTSVSDTHTTNVGTNCGAQFIRVDADINGYKGGIFYWTNSLKNWGNATDIFILSIADTNTNGAPAMPWDVRFEDLSGNRITNIKIAPGETNDFLFVVKVSATAAVSSYAEFKITAKSSNSALGHNTTIYTGDNDYNYGGPDNGGLGVSGASAGYVNIYSNSTPAVVNNEYIRVTIIKVSNYYVNDKSLSGDVWCSAVGDDNNSGVSISAPKFTLTNLLNTYNLDPGDTVYIDTGIYTQSFTIENDDRGDSSRYLSFIGAGTDKTIFDATNLNFCVRAANNNYLRLSSFFLSNANNQNLYFDYTTNSVISNVKIVKSKGDGIFFYDSDNNIIKDTVVERNINHGINFYHSCDKNNIHNSYISNCNIGIRIRNSSSNVISGNYSINNSSSGIYLTNSGETFITNNNLINNSGDGISAPGCDNLVIYSNNFFKNSADGISLFYLNGDYADNNIIKKNISKRNSSDGMHINGDKNIISDNIFSSNINNGMDLYGATNYIYRNTIISNHATGIWLGGASGIVISNNNIAYSGADGIGTAGKSGTTFISNKIYHNNSSGISLWWSGSGCDNHIIKKNIIYGNTGEGIYIDGNNNFIISNSVYSNNNNGIYMVGDVFTNMFNLAYGNNQNGILAKDLDNTLIRNSTLFKNGYNGIKVLNPNNVYIRNCISVSNSITGYTNYDNLNYSLAYGNTGGDFTTAPGTGCITNNAYFQTTDSSKTNFLYLSGTEPSPAIDAGDPTDPVPSNGGLVIDMGCFEYTISPSQINIVKSVNKTTLQGVNSSSIPGATVEYKIHYTNLSGIAEQIIVYDKIPVLNSIFVSNSFTNSENGWSVEFSTNTNITSQAWNSSDYTAEQPSPGKIIWIRWKKSVVGATAAGNLFYRIIIK